MEWIGVQKFGGEDLCDPLEWGGRWQDHSRFTTEPRWVWGTGFVEKKGDLQLAHLYPWPELRAFISYKFWILRWCLCCWSVYTLSSKGQENIENLELCASFHLVFRMSAGLTWWVKLIFCFHVTVSFNKQESFSFLKMALMLSDGQVSLCSFYHRIITVTLVF